MTVIIIGGGASGLTAGLTLLLHGIMKFVILESSDTIGGRLNTKGSIELGAPWIHNDNSDNEFMTMLKEEDLITEKKNIFWQSSMTLSNGDKVSSQIVNKLRLIIDSVATADWNDLGGTFGDQLRNK